MSIISAFRNNIFFKILYWTARIGLGLTFITSGIRKLPGIHFTGLAGSDPVGAYFSAMEATGLYWNFIGYFQIIIGVTVFFNRFVILSCLLLMPVTINIFLISVSLHMYGTPVITALMVLGNLYLLLWHYENYKTVLHKPINKNNNFEVIK